MKGIRKVKTKKSTVYRVTLQVGGVGYALGNYYSSHVAARARLSAETMAAAGGLTNEVVQHIIATHKELDTAPPPSNKILRSQNGVVDIDVSSPRHPDKVARLDYDDFEWLSKLGRLITGNLRNNTVVVAGKSVAGLICSTKGNRVEYNNGDRMDLRKRNLKDSGICVIG